MQLVRKVEVPGITKEYIMSKLSDYDIYRMYVPDAKVGRMDTKTPYRTDKTAGSWGLFSKEGKILWKEFAGDEDSGDCIKLVMKMYGLTFGKAIKKIAQDFGLTAGNGEYEKIIAQYEQPEIADKRRALIQITTRRMTQSDVAYWAQYLIDRNDLKVEGIHAVKELYINRKKEPISAGELVYAYHYPEEGFKVYMPQRPKGSKWKSNIPVSRVVHMENMNKSQNTLIVPNLKDYIVCRKIYPHVIQIQNESLGALPDQIGEQITQGSQKVFYGGNSDKPGKEASYKITNKYKWKHINPPDRLLPDGKDFSDWAKLEGLKPIEEHLIKKGVI